jgi:hypothetical protein
MTHSDYRAWANYCNELKLVIQYHSVASRFYKAKCEEYRAKIKKLEAENDKLVCNSYNSKITFTMYQMLSVVIYISMALLIYLKS